MSRAEQTEVHRRRNAVTRFRQERDRALADPATTALKRARLTFNGGGMTTAALAALSGVSRETIRKAEADPRSVSRGVLRRLCTTLKVTVREVAP